MVWYERYGMRFEGTIEGIPCMIILDAYGDLNGVNYKGRFIPIPPQ